MLYLVISVMVVVVGIVVIIDNAILHCADLGHI